MATVREIAELAGVSPSTVSRVINGNVPVKDKARNKVLSAMQRLDKAADLERNVYSGEIGIIMPTSSAKELAAHPSLYTVMLSFIETISQKQIGNTTILIDERSDMMEVVSHNVSGYLIIGTSEKQEEKLLPVLLEKGLPFIFINRMMGNKHASCVNIDDEQATEIAMKYLLSLGHREIAFIGGNPGYNNTKLRYKSYINTLVGAGIQPNEDYVIFGEYSEKSGEELGRQFLNLKKKPTAACVASDPIAIGFMRYLKKRGIKIPEDVSVIGFGNVEASSYVTPPLTTILQDSRAMGRVAALTMIQMLENPVICRQQILLRTELVIRDSCTKPRIS